MLTQRRQRKSQRISLRSTENSSFRRGRDHHATRHSHLRRPTTDRHPPPKCAPKHSPNKRAPLNCARIRTNPRTTPDFIRKRQPLQHVRLPAAVLNCTPFQRRLSSLLDQRLAFHVFESGYECLHVVESRCEDV